MGEGKTSPILFGERIRGRQKHHATTNWLQAGGF